jgi:outer membrane protein assembly factor BamB
LDAGNGFGGGIAPAAANTTASLGNVGQDNVSTMQAFQGSRMAYMAGNTFNCMGDELVCTEAGTGNIRWRFKLEGDLKKEGGFLGSPPATAGGRIFLATLKGEVLQSDPATGAIEKKYAVGSPVRSQPVIEGGRIYVGTQDGRIVCFDTGDSKFTGWNHWGCNAARTGTPNEKK